LQELSGHLLIRTGGFLVLTLVATMLPANTLALPAPQAPAQESSSGEDTPPPGRTPDSSPGPAQPAPPPSTPAMPDTPARGSGDSPSQGTGAPDMGQVIQPAIWSGQDSRCSFPGTTPSLLAELMKHPYLAFSAPSGAFVPACIESPVNNVHAQRGWLACRQAHAPPIG